MADTAHPRSGCPKAGTGLQREAIAAPLYWRDDGTEFTLGGRREIDWAAPVAHVSYFEADAFARWAGARLPTEAEWEDFAASADPNHRQPARRGRRRRARAPAAACSATSGNGRRAPSLPTPGSRRPSGAVGEYNGKFMCGQFVLKGASCATPRGHSRASYRNFFPPTARWQFTGFALLETLDQQTLAFRDDVLAGLAAADTRNPGPLALRSPRLGAVRRNHAPAVLLSDAHRNRDLPRDHARCRRSRPARAPRSSSSAPDRRPRRRSCSRRSSRPLMFRSTFPATISSRARPSFSSSFPAVDVMPVVADFARPFDLAGRDRRPAQARLLPRLDHRQFRAAQRDRPAAPVPRRCSGPGRSC